MKTQVIPRSTPIFTGTIARLAIQCICPDTGEKGSFLFTGESHFNKGSRVTPVYEDLQELFSSVKPDWREIQDGNAGLGFISNRTIQVS